LAIDVPHDGTTERRRGDLMVDVHIIVEVDEVERRVHHQQRRLVQASRPHATGDELAQAC
jgi:hypothetical protein